jgi:DNA uptake protein ComE-like DNA-binding protein
MRKVAARVTAHKRNVLMLLELERCWVKRPVSIEWLSMRSDHKALLFLAGIAALGATVRVARAVSAPEPPGGAALEHQMQAADSAKRSLTAKRPDKSRRPAQSKRGSAGTTGVAQQPTPTVASPTHRDYKGRLDLDLATATEIDSLPNVGPILAKRIVADRMVNGAFRELTALRRVRGVSLKLLASLDSLIGFSGINKPPLASDTVIAGTRQAKHR